MARTRAQDYAAKRSAILRKSAELFARHGYSGTSIAMIAEACGASKALLYHYYPDKEAVLFDILSTHLEALIAIAGSAAAAAEPKARLHALSASLLEAYRDADAEHQVQTANLKMLPDDKQEALRAMERKLVALFADAIAEAAPEIGRSAMLKPITMSLFGMLNWHYLWFRDSGELSRADYARMATALILEGARGAVAAAEASPPKRLVAHSPAAKPAPPAKSATRVRSAARQ